MIRRLARASVLGLVVLTMSATSVFAHECFNASRSDRGNVAAGTHSKVWEAIPLEEAFAFIGAEQGLPELSDAQLAWALDAALDAGAPSTLTLFVGTHTIAGGTPAMETGASDGKGIDHAFEGLVPMLAGIYVAALEA
jgi:hypothetical protein